MHSIELRSNRMFGIELRCRATLLAGTDVSSIVREFISRMFGIELRSSRMYGIELRPSRMFGIELSSSRMFGIELKRACGLIRCADGSIVRASLGTTATCSASSSGVPWQASNSRPSPQALMAAM